MLPVDFLDRMERMLPKEYSSFLKSYEEQECHALRVNRLKGDRETFLSRASFHLEPVAWCENGYYYDKDDRPGRHPYHDAGAYYIQEASAMAPAEYLEAQPGERILDLCAAPGGKCTQIGADMHQQGILVCNEIHPARAKILSENVERMGLRNGIVTNESPGRLAQAFPEYFDRILVDAPCSGEGMFRKNPEACGEWSLENVDLCAKRQDGILSYAADMLKPGGRLVYSTCTFAPQEDEGTIRRFLDAHEEFSLVPVEKVPGMEPGNPRWGDEMAGCAAARQESGAVGSEAIRPEAERESKVIRPGVELSRTIRLWPHKLRGEGHYLAVLEKAGKPDSVSLEEKGISLPAMSGNGGKIRGLSRKEKRLASLGKGKLQAGLPEKSCKEYLEFRNCYLKDAAFPGIYLRFGDQLYLAPPETPDLSGIKVLRPGLHLGTIKKNRLEPSHALAMTLNPGQAVHVLELSSATHQAEEYIKGYPLKAEGEKGWYLITVDGYGIGWGKLSGMVLKNHYPKGLRKG